MYTIIEKIILIISISACTCLTKHDFLNPVINKILEIDVCNICIFKNEEIIEYSVEFNHFFEKITAKIPTFTIDISNRNLSGSNQYMAKTTRAFESDLFFMIENSRNFNVGNVKSNVNAIAASNPLPRAKFLLIVIGDTHMWNSKFKQLLVYSWTLKFLDFSILIVNLENHSFIINYNPFFKKYNRNKISSAQLFPDKQKNMNGYKVKTLLYNRPPFIQFTNESNKISIKGKDHEFLKITSKVLNFKFEYVKIKDDISEEEVFEKIETGEIDISIECYALGMQLKSLYKKSLLIGKVIFHSHLGLIFPVSYKNVEPKINLYTIFCGYLTALIIMVTMIVIRLCKFNPFLWTPIYVFGLLFGISLDKKPQKGYEKIVFIIVALISIQFSSIMFSAFHDNEVLVNTEIEFDAFEEIKKPSFPIYLHKTFFQSDIFYDDEVISNLKAHSKPINDTKNCFKKLANKQNRICVASVFYAEFLIQKYSNPDEPPIMKIAQPVLLSDFPVHIYENGSPFVKKFDEKFQHILESGVFYSSFHGKNYVYSSKNQNVETNSDDNIIDEFIIFIIGCVFGVLTFVFEFIIKSKIKFYI